MVKDPCARMVEQVKDEERAREREKMSRKLEDEESNEQSVTFRANWDE